MAANKRKIQANAQKYLQKGQLDKAQKEYQQLVKLDPRDSNSRLKLGDIALRRGEKDGAAEAYLKVAEQFMKDGFDAKAVAIYKQVGKIDPDRLDIFEPLAELYQRLGLTSEALAALQTAADAYHRDGRKRDALELLRKMATLDPTNTISRLKIADLLRQADMPEDALAEYDAVAEELARQGARDELLGVYDRILELDPERTATIAALAQILVDQGHVERAEPFARKLIEQSPDVADGHELLARIHTELGREDAAAETYKTLAEVYRRVGDDDKAREISQRIFGSEIAADGISEAASLGGDLSDLPDSPPCEEASPDLMEQTLDLSGGEAAAGFSADSEQLLAEASVYLRYGKADRAIATLDGLLATEPDHRPALEKLGEAHAGRGDSAKAIEIWKRAVEIALVEEDETGAATLRSRIEALESGGDDSAAAPAAPQLADEPDGELADDELELDDDISIEDLDVPVEEESDPEPEIASDAPAEADAEVASLDDEVDLEIDLGDETLEEDALEEEIPLEDDSDEAANPDEIDLELDDEFDDDQASVDADADIDPDDSMPESPPEPVSTGEADRTIVQMGGAEATVFQTGDVDAESAGSATTPAQIAESLEEADFYFEQGLFDEAEGLYQKVLESAPNHPQAMLRLGEIADRRGDGPGSSGSGVVEVVGATQANADSDAESMSLSDSADTESGDADAGGEALSDGLGDELVEWGEDDAGDDAAEAAADDESDLELDVDLSDDLGAVDADVNADTAVSMQPPETQPEIELSLDSDSADGIEGDLDDETPGVASEAEAEQPAPEPDPEPAPEEVSAPEPTPEPDAESVPMEAAAEDAIDADADPVADPEPDAVALDANESGIDEEVAEDVEDPSDDGDTFDLAAELSDVFDGDDAEAQSGSEGDDGFDAIFREFKKGVKEQLSDSDYEAHYDLGIAYREMGLLDDAVGEFQTALDSSDLKLSSLHMLGLCALDLDQPNDATAHFEQALSLPAIPNQQQAALRYDLGRAFEVAGDPNRARAAYEAVSAVDPQYQDVADRLAALEDGGEETPEPVETFESFDDLIAEAEAVLDTDRRDEPEEPEVPQDAAPSMHITQALEDTAPELEAELEPVEEPVLEAVLEPEAELTVQAEQTSPTPEGVEVVEDVDDEEPDPEPVPRRRRKKISFL